MKSFKNVLKVIAIVFYSIVWFCVECVVLFIVKIMPAPWRVFKKTKRTNDDTDDHNWDPKHTDLEYYDMVDDD